MDMGINRQKVQNFLNENFDISCFKVTEMPFVPGGVVLTDDTGSTMLIYWDMDRDKIAYQYK